MVKTMWTPPQDQRTDAEPGQVFNHAGFVITRSRTSQRLTLELVIRAAPLVEALVCVRPLDRDRLPCPSLAELSALQVRMRHGLPQDCSTIARRIGRLLGGASLTYGQMPLEDPVWPASVRYCGIVVSPRAADTNVEALFDDLYVERTREALGLSRSQATNSEPVDSVKSQQPVWGLLSTREQINTRTNELLERWWRLSPFQRATPEERSEAMCRVMFRLISGRCLPLLKERI